MAEKVSERRPSVDEARQAAANWPRIADQTVSDLVEDGHTWACATDMVYHGEDDCKCGLTTK